MVSARVADSGKRLFMHSSGSTASRFVFFHQYCLLLLVKVHSEMMAFCAEANPLKKLNTFQTLPHYVVADTRVFVQNLRIQRGSTQRRMEIFEFPITSSFKMTSFQPFPQGGGRWLHEETLLFHAAHFFPPWQNGELVPAQVSPGSFSK